ncbi:hypothetical protein, partial [Idiomarina sp. UBA1919]|uniref:hypothetical protein n=1 Tax=Idiomarina sp. UBA1919 TaxID=1946640 RepID=UPI00257C120E
MKHPYRLVRRGANKGQTITVRELSPTECWLINNVAHHSWQDPTFRRYQEKLKEWKEKAYWLSCDCHPEAVLYLRQAKNHITLLARSDSQYHSHEDNCDFARSTREDGDKKGGLPKATKDHVFIRDLVRNDEEPQANGNNRAGGHREDTLFRLMKKLLISAQLDVIRAGHRPQESQARNAIKSAAENFTVGGVPMDKGLFFFPYWNDMANALRTLPFKQNVTPHVLTWWLVKEYRQHQDGDWEVLVKSSPRRDSERWYRLNGTRLSFHHTRGRRDQWAILMLIYTESPDGNGNYFPRGYLAPVVSSNHWMVVDSMAEKSVAVAGRQAMEKSELDNLVMQKPLTERLETNGAETKLVLPDFIFRRES